MIFFRKLPGFSRRVGPCENIAWHEVGEVSIFQVEMERLQQTIPQYGD